MLASNPSMTTQVASAAQTPIARKGSSVTEMGVADDGESGSDTGPGMEGVCGASNEADAPNMISAELFEILSAAGVSVRHPSDSEFPG